MSSDNSPSNSESVDSVDNIHEQLGQPIYNLVIMDFHGTMTDHQLRLIKALNVAAKQTLDHDRRFPINSQFPFSSEFYLGVFNRPTEEDGKNITTYDYLKNELLKRGYSEARVGIFLDSFKQQMNSLYIPIPGILTAVKRMISLGVDVVVLTNGSQRSAIQETLQGWGLNEQADYLYSGHNLMARKPNSKTVQQIVRERRGRGTHITRNNVLMVGDYIDDIHTAVNAGIDSVLVVRRIIEGDFHLDPKLPRPTYIIDQPATLLKIVCGTVEEVPSDIDSVRIYPTLWR